MDRVTPPRSFVLPRSRSRRRSSAVTRLDYVVITSSSLSRPPWLGYAPRTGLVATPGGSHPEGARVTHWWRRAIPTLRCWLSSAPRPAAAHPLGQRLLARTADDDVAAGVSLAIDDLDTTRLRPGLIATPGKRTTSDGQIPFRDLAGMDAALGRGLPFFIQCTRRPAPKQRS